jgi:TonB-dependent receptor
LSHPELPSPFPEARTFFRQDATIMQQTNYRFNENYLGLYIMSDINISDLITFSPGFRYEKVFDNIWGWYTIQLYESSKANGHATIATHSDEYFLPNMRLKIKPTEWMNIFLAYTNTLNRPDYYSLVPINYINTNGSPETLNMGNPELKPEFWSNYDLQVSIFGNEIGYLGISGFYKKVKNMIWTPTIIRSPGDPLIPGFEDVFGPNARVNITEPVNNNYDVLIKGLEFEWQTNFWYLPKPFSYLTLDINYTLMNSATRYPRTQTINTIVGTDNRGRPIYKLITTYYADEASMINQPNNIANCSLGFNYMDLNVWLSYSFTGKKLLSESQLIEENVYALNYSRYDLQVTQGLPLKGLELLFNFANFNNPTENSIQSGDIRPTYLENYGWTVDFGLRYKL